MKFISKKGLTILASAFLFLVPSWQSAQAQCEVGPILFRDTLFGAGIGAGVGALVLIANETSDKVPAKIATATLIGAGLGAMVGVIELSLSDCGSGNRHVNKFDQPGFHAEPLFTYVPRPNFYGKNQSESENSFEIGDLTKMTMGLKLQYTFEN
ncbi:hypothetical protein [Fluviispira vulneris]|uniref:hypothetical protein n=1 Tax=Fluviispira vulneris TaxID=2763012 RepID=UPI0016449BF5|nr:hypothetical protein [Fluviispira vulneris]